MAGTMGRILRPLTVAAVCLALVAIAGSPFVAGATTEGVRAEQAGLAPQPLGIDPGLGPVGIQIEVVARIQGSRLIVVNSRSEIIAIYSNTVDADAPVHVRLGAVAGPELAPASEVMDQYRALEGSIDWRRFGQVYGGP